VDYPFKGFSVLLKFALFANVLCDIPILAKVKFKILDGNIAIARIHNIFTGQMMIDAISYTPQRRFLFTFDTCQVFILS